MSHLSISHTNLQYSYTCTCIHFLFTGGWAASVYDSFQYLKIDLEGLWEITSITNKDISRWSWYHTQSFRYYNLGYRQYTSFLGVLT